MTEALNKEYETIYVLKPDVGREVTEAIANRVTDVIKDGGAVSQIENWGRRKLAYPVQKYKRGVYVYFKYLGGGLTVTELERTLRLQEAVMKFQTVKTSDAGVVSADAPAATFEHIEELDGEEDESLAQELGLDMSSRMRPSRGYSDDQSSDDSDSDDGSRDSDDDSADNESSEGADE